MPTSNSEGVPISNSFDALKFYEPSQAFSDAPALPKPDHYEPLASDTREAERLAAAHELIFAWIIMIDDLNDLRKQIMQIWGKFRDGNCEAATAALATNTAIDLARSIMEDVVPLTTPFGGFWEFAHEFHEGECERREIVLEEAVGEADYEAYDIARHTLVGAQTHLQAFLQYLHPKQIPIIPEGHFGVYDPSSDRRTMTGEEKLREDKFLLMHMFTEQITVLDDEIAAFNEFHKSSTCKTWPAANDKHLQDVQKEIRWVHSDPIHQEKTRVRKSEGVSSAEGMQPQLLLSSSPVLAGLWLFRFRARSWNMGIVVNQTWGSIIYSAHLYNAMEIEKVIGDLDNGWSDMDIAQSIFGPQNFFIGNHPKTRPEYLKKFLLSIGMSAAAFAQSGRAEGRKLLVASKAGPRVLKGDAAVSKMFFPRYLERSGQIDWTPEHVNEIISRSGWETQESEEFGPSLVQSHKPLKTRQQEAAKSSPVSPPELIEKLTTSLHVESMELSFLYLKMHCKCWKFLRAIRDACDPTLCKAFGPAYLVKEPQLPCVVGWIFQALAGRCKIEYAESLLQSCGEVFEEMAAREDDSAVCRAMEELGYKFRFMEDLENEGDK
ncbi:hypothetical protein F5X68DRAFT_255210 [Plectosphaerella plurivora]|uniref:DUF6604 domain-containing protein n=1 Tax=Plectosphaerella plurivora TaxID=936078 RepID=A0A9P8VEZ0_9PEZI|nr:hypothetical protein F5X68DRAFT_255210 [Plectosphaerella plurivora]